MEYHKIDTVFKRNPENKFKTLMRGEYSNKEFEYLKNNTWVFTEKIDGTNIRIIIRDNNITFGGRTDNAQIPATLVTRLYERFMPQKDALLEHFPNGAILYGEGYGAKIQNGENYRQDQDFILFDVKIDNWVPREAIEDIASKFGLDVVPIIGEGTLIEMVEKTELGFNSTWGDFQAEGIVARPFTELRMRNGNRIITKIKCKDF